MNTAQPISSLRSRTERLGLYVSATGLVIATLVAWLSTRIGYLTVRPSFCYADIGGGHSTCSFTGPPTYPVAYGAVGVGVVLLIVGVVAVLVGKAKGT